MTWRDITIKQYMEIKAIPADTPTRIRRADLARIIFGWNKDKIDEMPIEKVDALAPLLDFINEPPPATFKKVVWLNGTRYKARLNPGKYSPNDGLSIIAHRNAGINKTLNKILARIYVPTFGRHNPERGAEDFLKAKVADVLGCFFLFSTKARLSNLAINAYKEDQMKMLQEHLEVVTNHFQSTGDGTIPSGA